MGIFSRKHSWDENAPLTLWMADAEYGQIQAILKTLRPRTCVEWGSGGSTRFFLADHPFIERYISVEHDVTWSHRVRREVQDPRLEYFAIAPDVAAPVYDPNSRSGRKLHSEWRARAEQDSTVLATYVGTPATVTDSCDFAFVDGAARSFCIREGWRMLRSGGVLVLHDAQRPDYTAALHDCGTPTMLPGWSQGQVAMLVKP
jgi:hypothetical protein